MGEWISVEDEMPDKNQDVFIFERYSDVPFVGFWDGNSWCSNKDFVRVEGDAYLVDHIVQDMITHWQPIMPLPAPPVTI